VTWGKGGPHSGSRHLADKEVPGSSPGRPTTHYRRSERCRQQAGRVRCRLGPRWGRTPIPAGTSPGPSGAAHPGVRLGHDHPPWSRPQPEDGSHAACGHLALRLLPCPPRRRPRRRGPPPTRRPGSATDLPLTNATAAASPASRPPGPSSSRRRPGSHRFLGQVARPRRPGPQRHRLRGGDGRVRTDEGRHQTAGHRTRGQQTAGQQTAGRWTAGHQTSGRVDSRRPSAGPPGRPLPGDRTPDGWTAGSRTPTPDGGHRLLDTGDRRRGLPAGRVNHGDNADRSRPAGRCCGQTPSGRATTQDRSAARTPRAPTLPPLGLATAATVSCSVASPARPRLGALLSSCKGPWCLIGTRVPGLHVHPGWFRGWR
jgi:hypothetical protein